ncbi:LysM repeat-containing protein [Blastococcus sp. DSM 46786]|uniref:LysM peptidoglycan-binding domain-containing protein n=1 Tax=Blastococcus sp. DSM 46786 TaxID=1798227 RepID=UPI0008CD7EE9|nr:LysM domain-containing protein [Blastococcus sp. DSM 46786]SEM17757.1 LysM repeat-containing protein [Blastococcus sp. DSM 46786]
MTAVAYPAVVLAAASAVTLGAIGPAAAHTGEHTVRSGDTLSKLAAGHGTTWRSIHDANRDAIGADPNVLRVGQVLTIGGSGAAPAAAPAPAAGSYVVVAGDTLAGIAARHGTTWQDLHALNLGVIGPNANVLRVGQVLAVSGGGAVPERASRSERPAPAPAPAPVATSAAYDQWDVHVRPAVQEIAEANGVGTVLTRPGHSPTAGRAADFMVYTDAAKGNAVAQYVIDNAARLGADYVIWQQRIAGSWTGWAWQPMADRGSATANHMDHPHVAFLP